MNRLHALRKAKKVTLQQLSDATGLSIGSLSRYENSQRNPKIATVRTLANYFEVSSDYLEGLDGTANDLEDFGSTLYQLRKTSGLTQKELSRKLYMNDNAVQQYEDNSRTPKLSDIHKILSYFGKKLKVVDIDDKEENE
ncbi:helix-turn-helix domain-containing protein [Weissella paramesenteroides]|uniref:helix-turn-helix domain-containing protein n=1 Tax=Weissella paramesenteroides TaxID=1249 RepID=UPI00223BFFD0|nr:helix-turn-helix transcriptional regulator [Weissella paramesenteroides]MCT0485714.1 XRE family transcriptional regulator [Weissella paramesenteroides]